MQIPTLNPNATHMRARTTSTIHGICPHQKILAATSPVAAAAQTKNASTASSKRVQQLYELDLDDGWAVQPVAQPEPSKTAGSKNSNAHPRNSSPAPHDTTTKRRSNRGKKVLLSNNPVGALMAKQALAAQGAAAGPAGNNTALLQTLGASTVLPTRKKKREVYVDDDGNIIGEEDEDEDVTDKAPVFSLTIDDGVTAFEEYDAQGRIIRQDSAALPEDVDTETDIKALDDGEEDDDLDFSGTNSGWSALATVKSSATKKQSRMSDDTLDPVSGAPMSAIQVETLLSQQGATSSAIMLGGQEADDEAADWGLEEIKDNSAQTLMEQLGVVKKRKNSKKQAVEEESVMPGTLAADDVEVQWGGSGIRGVPAGADLAEQERLLGRMFKPHKVKELMAHQRAAYEAALDLKRGNSTRGKFGNEAKLHRQLRIVAGSAANKKLLSSQGSQTRPMMEKVRAAIFNMILSQAGSPSELPPNARWLDMFAGTGSVGLEALSRGAAQVHFVEFDPWVCRKILGANISSCGFNKQSIVHTSKAEDFLRRAKELPRFAGGAFDFISMCPPYLLVSYPQLFELLEGSPLLHDRTIMFVEYPKQLSHEVPDKLGPLNKVRDRKYGRTWIAVYAPPSSGLLTREEASSDELELEFDV